MSLLAVLAFVISSRCSGFGEPLDERDLIAEVVVTHLVDHSLTDQETKASGSKPQLLADVEMGEWVLWNCGVGQVSAVKA